ncbi:hypothetical protein DPMN_071594 [Dreissena polymorpha]|uniref:Uncharacterized protein n=1 Tax=Dreissena polymorpha TaxID=45954 RepID=A0A9D4BXD7_DREPO|nr:hypothetical protein DPMN_071594 [Dreissena polymorpha]
MPNNSALCTLISGECYEAWSRCSKWSRGATGWLWKYCTDRCKEFGYRGGNCVAVQSKCPLSSKALQCQCF